MCKGDRFIRTERANPKSSERVIRPETARDDG
jgi:hypothetical protein